MRQADPVSGVTTEHTIQEGRGAVQRARRLTIHPALRPLVPLLALVVLAAAGCGGGVLATAASASASPRATYLPPLPHDRAGKALTAFDKAFYVQVGASAYHRSTTDGGRANPWTQAEMIEMVEDAYQTSHKPVYKKMVVALENGMAATFGSTWTRRSWNDDILWMIIASLRAHEITGNPKYLARAKRNFDTVYARAWDGTFGGGLWWRTDHAEKNVTTNAPAVIAACKLYRETHDSAYLAKARRIYRWLRSRLYDANTGAVADGISSTGVRQVDFSYNYGTVIGAADLLYRATHDRRYYDDALRALRHAQEALTVNGILRNESNGRNGNLGGFKGIFARWAVRFTTDNHVHEFDAWFRDNADAAWSQRNARGLMGSAWTTKTPTGRLRAFDCSSGVVMVIVAPAAAQN